MDIHAKSVDMDMDKDGKFHTHGNPGNRMVTLKNRTRDANTLRAQYLENSWR